MSEVTYSRTLDDIPEPFRKYSENAGDIRMQQAAQPRRNIEMNDILFVLLIFMLLR